MAFNFNWSPLAADASFYTRAQELLTAALNKSPKPPIIVDAILVTELNLGSVPPDLEILEIGDLAEDRFRGIFKMKYAGDAFLTLRTRVQANPLNTFLSTRPAFASPDPLAAASGLTIPLKITLSAIKLSAFIILVFSRQKGVTLVFRNDPLESLKVSSTFDSIPFVRDYLQKEIEAQLRTLLINEVPAIIHRLSLRLFVPEYRAREEEVLARSADAAAPRQPGAEPLTDPLASPPRDPVDARGHALDPAQIAHLALDASPEAQALFSRKNLLRLAALRESQRTLSLFTLRLDDVVYRAATGPPERRPAPTEPRGGPLRPALRSLGSATLRRAHASTPSLATLSATSEHSAPALGSARPPLTSVGTSFTTSAAGSRPGRPGRRRKHRVVDLRTKPTAEAGEGDAMSVSGESSASGAWSGSAPTSAEDPRSAPAAREGEVATPPSSPPAPRASPPKPAGRRKLSDATPRPPARVLGFPAPDARATPRPPPSRPPPTPCPDAGATLFPDAQRSRSTFASEKAPATPPRSAPLASASHAARPDAKGPAGAAGPTLAAPFPYPESSPGGILEQAWMMRMAGEIARRVQAQKDAGGADSTVGDFWRSGGSAGEGGEGPPPAYRA